MLNVRMCAALLVPLVVVSVSAGAIISGPYSGRQYITMQDPIGQNFKMVGTAASKIGFLFTNWESSAQSVQLTLYRGADFSTMPLATNSVMLPAGFEGWKGAYFSTVRFLSGQTYAVSARVAPDADFVAINWSPWGSGYSGGTTIFKGTPDNYTDLGFFVSDSIIAGGDFGSGSAAGWAAQSAGGTGSVTVPYVGGSYVAQLTAGSTISLTQSIDLPAEPFGLHLDYRFLEPGTLDVILGGQVLKTVQIGAATDWDEDTVAVSSAALLGATDQLLELRFDSTTGSRLQLDDIYITDVPEPTTLPLLVVGYMVLRRRQAQSAARS